MAFFYCFFIPGKLMRVNFMCGSVRFGSKTLATRLTGKGFAMCPRVFSETSGCYQPLADGTGQESFSAFAMIHVHFSLGYKHYSEVLTAAPI
jgi:hypothetical protein